MSQTMLMNEAPLRFSVISTMTMPVFTGNEFFEEEVPCVVWGRWYERTGVLWMECVICDEASYGAGQLSAAHVGRFEDALVEEMCLKYF